MAWSLSAAASWTDGVRGLSALAAVAGGAWLGGVLRRPLEAACIALVAAAWPILGWAVVQRSFGSFDRYQATTRLSQPFGYPNAVGIFSVIVALVALWLVTRRPLAARAVGGATLALTFYVLPMTGSRGSLIALALGVVLFAWLQPSRVECAAALVAILIVAVPAAVWTLSLSALNVTLSGLQPSAGPALLLAGIAVVVAGAALAVLAVGAVERLGAGAYARAERRTWQAAIGIVVLGAIGFMALHGGPIGAVRSLWDGLAGGGGVNNEERPLREPLLEHALALVEGGLPRLPGPALARLGRRHVLDRRRAPQARPHPCRRDPQRRPARALGPRAARGDPGARGARGQLLGGDRRLPAADRREPSRGCRAARRPGRVRPAQPARLGLELPHADPGGLPAGGPAGDGRQPAPTSRRSPAGRAGCRPRSPCPCSAWPR